MQASPKLLVLGALLWVAHILIISALPVSPVKAILSDLIQLGLGLSALFACLRAAQRSRPFARVFWTLIATGIGIWCSGQMLGVYFGSILNLSTQQLWFVDVFYNVWTAPLLMALFLDPEADSEEVNWARILDFAQVGIVVVLVYVYFSHIAADGGVQSWALALATDGIITAGFLVRGGLTPADPTALMFRRIGLFRLVATLTDLYFALHLPGSSTGEWFDLVWSAPWLIPLATATAWHDLSQGKISAFQRSSAMRRLLITQLFPLLFPLIVLLTAAQILKVQLQVAAGAILVSFVLTYARLLITQNEQHRGAEELRNQHTLLQAIIEGTTEIIFVKDLNGRYLMVNAAASQALGRAVTEIVGKNDRELFPSEMVERTTRADRKVMESRQPETYEESSTIGGVLRTHLVTKAPFRDVSGDVVGIIGVAVDVSDLKRTTEALANSEARFRSIFEDSPIGIAVMDVNGQAVAINNAYRQMLGLNRNEVVTIELIDELTDPDDRKRNSLGCEELARGERDHDRCPSKYVLRDDRIVWVDLNRTLLRSPDGRPQYLMLMAIDVTESKRLEEQLVQSQKMEAIGKLSGGIAHDFNNLLTVIKGYSSLILDRAEPSEFRTEVQRILDASDKAASLIHQLLAFSRRQVMQPKVFDLNGLLLNLEKMLRRLIGEHIEIVTETGLDIGFIKADPTQIEQLIMNLVVNAKDAMPKGGKLTLQTAVVNLVGSQVLEEVGSVNGRYVLLTVSDTGFGIDAETKAHIFEPFFTTKARGHGTGLGLSMVYGIVKQSGGHLSVDSEPGRGTSFKIFLPWVEGKTDSPNFAERPLSRSVRGQETILLVEDDNRVREFAKAVLTGCGYAVLIAQNPHQAMSISEEYHDHIDLLLTDVVLPGASGRELAEKVVRHRASIRVLYMSGYTDDAITHHGVLEDGMFFLEKPFTPALLAQKVREVLDVTKTARVPA
jgi:two-component system, cell cycle sensor histidine kinase and response regulator CckA